MKGFWRAAELTLASGAALLNMLYGDWDGLLTALLCFVILDYVTGVICAIVDHRLSSQIGFKGVCKKVLIFIMVGIGHLLDAYVLGSDGSMIRTAVIVFYLANEGLSIVENAGHVGLPIPKKLKLSSPRPAISTSSHRPASSMSRVITLEE